ncbi:fluoride efflux transporter CrcB [Bacillaceae bacterium Marseille-Q3522]|nr:fluoride efflux transporter CrcB [Bacillaceae bacterium Marseille-Q3522]
MAYLFIAVFAVLGAILRYLISLLFISGGFPFATLTINLIGCFLLVMVLTYMAESQKFSKSLITGIGTGFIGSFTTFSTFSVESVKLIEQQAYFPAAIYIAASMIGGLLFAYIGYSLCKKLLKKDGVQHEH